MSQTPSLATWYAGFGSRKAMRVFGDLWQFYTILKPQTIGDYTLVRSAPWYTNPFTTRYSSAPCPRSPPEESIQIVTVVNSSISPTKCIHLVFSDVKEFFIKYLLHCIYCDSFSSILCFVLRPFAVCLRTFLQAAAQDATMPHSYGYRARTRDMFARDFRKNGVNPLSIYLRKYKASPN